MTKVRIVILVLVVLALGLGAVLAKPVEESTEEERPEKDSGISEAISRKKDDLVGFISKKADKIADKVDRAVNKTKQSADLVVDKVDQVVNKTKQSADLVQNAVADVYQKVLMKKLNYTEKLKFFAKNGLAVGGLDKIFKKEITIDSFKDPIVKNMVKLYQKVHNLNVTGMIDELTELKMLSPRCGHSDFSREFDLNENETKTQPKMAEFKAVARWNRTHLRYKFKKYNEDRELGKDKTRLEIKTAFSYWADVTPLTFEEVCEKCPSDFIISFDSFEHGDGAKFDGPGGTLAHAFYPSDGRIHFDESEIFTFDTKEGVNLRLVAAHEFGHALGLDHSYAPGALMNPYYSGYIENFKLPEDDVMGIQALYGRKSKSTVKTTTTQKTTTKKAETTTTTKTTTTKKVANQPRHFLCDEEYDAVFTNAKNDLFVLHDYENLWKFDQKSKKWSKEDLWATYKGIEDGVRGGLIDKNKVTWFFKGRYVYAFSANNSLLANYPKYVKNPVYPVNPYAAVYKNNHIYLLKGRFAYKFDTATLNIVNDNIEMVEEIFPGLPTSIKSAVKIGDFYYMFKDKTVYKYDIKKNKVIEEGKSWAACAPGSLNSPTTTSEPKTTEKKKKKWYQKIFD